MLAAEYSTLDPESRVEHGDVFSDYEIWLTRVLAKPRTKGDLSFAGKTWDEARFAISSLERPILIARIH
jgi:hypothetical protein